MGEVFLERIVDYSIEFTIVLFGVKNSSLVQILTDTDVEAAFEWSVGRFALNLAEGKIFVDRRLKIFLKRADIRAFIRDGIPDADDTTVQYPVLGTVED